jgi:WD40 repeat protein
LKSNQQLEAIVAAIRSAKQAQALGEVEFFDKALGALQRVIYATQERNRLQVDQIVMSLAYSPDGKLLATGEQSGIGRLWEISGREIAQLQGHDGWLGNAVFSPNGELLATCGQDGTIRLWNTSGQEFACMKGHEGVIWSIQFSPNGNLLGSRGQDGTVRLWDTISDQQIAQFKSEQGDITSFTFSANGTLLATGAENGSIQLWNTSGEAPARLASFNNGDNSVRALAFSPTHDLLAAGAGGILQLWHTSGKLLESQEAYEAAIWNLVFSPDGNVLAAGTFYDHVSMWDVSEQRLVSLFTDLGQAGGKYLKIAFSPNGQLFAVGCYDANVQLWSSSDWLTHSREGTQIRGHQGRIWDLAFSPDSKHLVTTGEDAIVRIWDTSIMKPVLLQEDKNDVEVAAFSSDIQDKGNTVTSPNGELIATIGEDNTVQLRNSDGSKPTQLKSYQGTVMRLAFSPDSNRLAIAGGDMGIPFGHGFLQLWDISTEKLTHFTTGSWYGVIYNLTFSPDGRRLVTYEGKDGTCRVWDLFAREIACFRNITGVLGFSADGKQLVMRGDDDTVTLCQLGGLEELLAEACSMVCNYLQNNSKVSESDRHLCDHIETLN